MTASAEAALLVRTGIAILASCVLVGMVRSYTLRRALLDHPTDRSSHSVPTPRGGGLGAILAFLGVFGVAALSPGVDWLVWLALGGVVIIGLVGWLDDHSGLSVAARLAAHIAAGAMLAPLALSPTPVPAWLGPAAAVWWLIWATSAINVVNFMDGIDGLIGLQSVIFGAHLVLVGPEGGLARPFGVALGGASLGFLFWNWAPAKIFLGDVGSGALGIAMVLGGLLLMRESGTGLVAAYLPLYPIFLDATVTLIRRARRGEPLTVAHRSHLYQELAAGWGHAPVAALYGLGAAAALPIPLFSPPLQRVTFVVYFVLIAASGWLLQHRQQRAYR